MLSAPRGQSHVRAMSTVAQTGTDGAKPSWRKQHGRLVGFHKEIEERKKDIKKEARKEAKAAKKHRSWQDKMTKTKGKHEKQKLMSERILQIDQERERRREASRRSPSLRSRQRDAEWEVLEAARRNTERTMLHALEGMQAGRGRIMRKEEMKGPEYDRYWAQIKHLANTRLELDGQLCEDTVRSRDVALMELQRIHVDMHDSTAQVQVCNSIDRMKRISGSRIRVEQLFPYHAIAQKKADSMLNPDSLRQKIMELEARLQIQKENPPTIPPERFEAWRDKLNAKYELLGRTTARAMWRRNKKIAMAAKKNEEDRQELEMNWKAEILELEQTLHMFKTRLELRQSGSLEKMRELQARQEQLDEEGKRLSQEEKEAKWKETRMERNVKKAEVRKEKNAIRVERKAERLAEAGIKRVAWHNAISKGWRKDQEEAEAVMSPSGTRDAFEDDFPRATREPSLERRSETETEPESQPGIERKSERVAVREAAPIVANDALKSAEKGDELPDYRDNTAPRSTKNGTEPQRVKSNIAHTEKKDAKGGADYSVRKVAPDSIRKIASDFTGQVQSIEEDKTQASGTVHLPTEFDEPIPEQRDPIADARQQQLRGIRESITHLNGLASGARENGRLRIATAKKLEKVLDELEREAAAIEDENKPQSLIRYHSTTTGFKPISDDSLIRHHIVGDTVRYSNENPAKLDDALTRKQRVEQKEALDASTQLNESKPVHTWPSTSPDALLPRSLLDQLKAQLPSSNKIVIDNDLTVDVEADVPQLQNQIFELSQKLKQDYPLMDTLPYDVWKSEQRRTLRTWLKILIWKWQTRNDEVNAESAEADPDVSQDVRALLDQMVLDHDLDQRAATRMAKRWAETFSRKELRKVDPNHGTLHEDDELDWSQMDAGLGFLGDEGAAVDAERENMYTAKKPLPEDLPFTASRGKPQGYRFGRSSRVHASPVWDAVNKSGYHTLAFRRAYSTARDDPKSEGDLEARNVASPSHLQASLPHLTSSGSAHMVSVASKASTERTAIATGTVRFSNPTPLSLIRSASNKKGDVLSVSRIAGIMAAKHTPTLIPLCHPIALTHVGVRLSVVGKNDQRDKDFGSIVVESRVQCTGQTGVEMEALTSVVGAALSVVDMCKAVDKGIVVGDVRVVLKEGGRSGTWREEGWESQGED